MSSNDRLITEDVASHFLSFTEGIKVYVDGESYGAVAINSSLVDQAKAQGVPADYAERWTSGTQLAPLDELVGIVDGGITNT